MPWKQVALQEEFAQFSSLSVSSTGSGNVNISENGIQLFGTATMFDDLTADITRAKTVGTRITFNDTENTLDFSNLSTLSDYAVQVFQIKHGWKVGSVVYPHIHFFQTEDLLPNLLLEYRWQINGQAKTNSWTRLPFNKVAFPFPPGPATLNQIIYTSPLTPPIGSELSDVIQTRIIRDMSNTSGLFTSPDNYTGNVSVTSFDIHIELDTLGSNTEYIK